jgi:hypothetical protein
LGKGQVCEVDRLRVGGGGTRRNDLSRRFRRLSDLRNRQDWQTLRNNNNGGRRPGEGI